MDKRIGIITGSGMQFPDVDILGKSYTRPATTINLDPMHFVVVSPHSGDVSGWIDELQAMLNEEQDDDGSEIVFEED